MSTSNNIHTTGRYSVRMRRFALLQAVLQVSVALTPAWAMTAVAQQTPAPSELHDYLNPAAQLAQSGNYEAFAAQQASGMATQQLQQWLQNFGTARVEFGINSKFAPQTGSVDLLLPLYDSPDRLFFTQNGIRLKEGQATGNFGLGQRHFIDDWMVGYNAFYDENFSQGHKRFGIGLETWRDYLKLSANGYLRISDWKNADDLTDYQARPANGFDLRAEGWLADYPSLSARLMYEQYYGSEVALFGKDKRQKNPMAVTAGLSWTPVPMFSLSADHKAGGNQNESLFGLQMNWQFGRSLESQLDPDQVSLGATLAGNGMDLVNRNNHIVLEYRKNDLMKLNLSAIEGVGTAVKRLDYQLESKYGLKEILWNDAALVQAGGQVSYQGNGQYNVTLPPFSLGGSNSYTLSGVAVDQRNNRSATATTTITVGRTDVSAVNSRVQPDDATLVADGKSTTRIGISLMDADNLPISGVQQRLKVTVREDELPETDKAGTVQSTASPGATKSATLGAITEKGNGLYEVTLTTGTRASLAVITISMDDVRLPQASVKQIADKASASLNRGELKLLNTGPVVANGTSQAQASARVLDGKNNPVPGVDVTFTLSGSARPVGGLVVKTNSQGIAYLSFTNTVAEKVTVTGKVGSGAAQSVEATFTADGSSASLNKGELKLVNTGPVAANGTSQAQASARVLDGKNNPVANVDVTFTLSGSARPVGGLVVKTDSKGIAYLSFTNTVAEKVTVTGKVGSGAAQSVEATFTADGSSASLNKGELKLVNTGAVVANGTSQAQASARVLDGKNNPVPGVDVTFTLSGSARPVGGALVVKTDSKGIALLSFTNTVAEKVTVTGKVGSGAPQSVEATFIADRSSAGLNKGELKLLNTGPVAANGTSQAQASARVLDGKNNPVANVDVTFTLSGSARPVGGLVVKTNSQGIALLSFTNTMVEKVKLTGKVGSGTPQSVEATFIADAATANIVASDVTTDVTKITADSTSSVLYTVTVKDALGHPVPNLDLVWSDKPDGSTLTEQTRTNSAGKATVRMHTRQRGDAVLQVSVHGKNKVSAPKVTVEQSRASYSDQMTPAKLNAVFEKSQFVMFQFTHSSSSAVFDFPAASDSNKGAYVEIWSHGIGGVYVYINGSLVRQQYEVGGYYSDGKKWYRTR